MQYDEFEPPVTLRHLVRCYWVLRSAPDVHAVEPTPPEPASEPAPEPALPDGSPELIFNLADPFHAVSRDGTRTEQPLAMLVGQVSGPFTVVPTGVINLLAVRFTACGASLICDDLSVITDAWADVGDLPDDGPRATLAELYSSLRHVEDDRQRIGLLNSALSSLLRVRCGPDAEVAAAVRAIVESHGTIALDALAESLGCSLRHLQRRFAVQVGIAPKLLARIRRFQRVFSAWRDDPRSLSRVAADCGYFDQPHLIRDFRDLAGAAPAAFLANQPEFTQLFLPTNPAR